MNTPSASKSSVPKEVQKAIAVYGEEIKKLKTQCGIMREKARKNQPKTATTMAVIKMESIVSEEELSELLANGWTFVATLSSGKCEVSNEAS